jgi:hypothetical protein
MVRKNSAIKHKRKIKRLLKKSRYISFRTCCICGDCIYLVNKFSNQRILAPSHVYHKNIFMEICDECFYDLNVIYDKDILLYYNEDFIEYEKGNHTHYLYVFDYSEKIKKKYVDFWIGI